MLKKITVLSLLSVKICFGMEDISYENYINSFVPVENEMNQENINPIIQNFLICPNAPKKPARIRNHADLRAIPIDFNNVNFIAFNDDNMDVEVFNHNLFAGETAFQR